MTKRNSERVEVIKVEGTENLLNLSATGVAFLFPRKIDKNDPVVVRINEITVEGLVVYCHERTDGFRIGMRFNQLSIQEQTTINKMVESFSCGVPLTFSVITSPLQQ